MGRFHHSFGSTRTAIGAFALYVLFLQGFFAAAAQAEALNFPLGTICSPTQSGTQIPGNGQHKHGLCCVLACAACGCAYLASDPGDFVAVGRLVSPAVFLPETELFPGRPYNIYLGARGPPRGL
jgi:hypothetical protein